MSAPGSVLHFGLIYAPRGLLDVFVWPIWLCVFSIWFMEYSNIILSRYDLIPCYTMADGDNETRQNIV